MALAAVLGVLAVVAGTEVVAASATGPVDRNDPLDRAAERFWVQRHSEHHGELKAVGHLGLTQAQNEAAYQVKARNLRDVIDKIRPATEGQDALLDVGCGVGALFPVFLELGFNVTGLDVSPLAVEEANSAYAHTGRARAVQAVIGEPLPVTGTFSVVTIVDVLFHILTRHRLEEFFRLLRPHVTQESRVVIQETLVSDEAYVGRDNHVHFRRWSDFMTVFEATRFRPAFQFQYNLPQEKSIKHVFAVRALPQPPIDQTGFTAVVSGADPAVIGTALSLLTQAPGMASGLALGPLGPESVTATRNVPLSAWAAFEATDAVTKFEAAQAIDIPPSAPRCLLFVNASAVDLGNAALVVSAAEELFRSCRSNPQAPASIGAVYEVEHGQRFFLASSAPVGSAATVIPATAFVMVSSETARAMVDSPLRATLGAHCDDVLLARVAGAPAVVAAQAPALKARTHGFAERAECAGTAAGHGL